MELLAGVLDFVKLVVTSRRGLFLLLLALIAISVVAAVANNF